MNLISCVNNDWSIGYNNRLLYNIPKDMQYFKSKTMNKTVIMGRKTYQSLRVKPLPNRYNIVLSNSITSNDVLICKSIQEVLIATENVPTNDIFIIGGESVYKNFLDMCSMAYITKVYNSCLADTFFPLNLDTSNDWILLEKSKIFEHENLTYSFNVYKRI